MRATTRCPPGRASAAAALACAVAAGASSAGHAVTLPEVVLPDVAGLPLVPLPAAEGRGDALVVLASGDGGWSNLDRQVGEELQRRGVSVVGLDTRAYYAEPHTPEASGADLDRALRHYLALWDKERVLLVGWSRGADALPFMVAHLSMAMRRRVERIVLLAAARRTNFKFRPEDTTDAVAEDGAWVRPALEALAGERLICLYGIEEEARSVCPSLPAGLATSAALAGGHFFDGDYTMLADRILEDLDDEGLDDGDLDRDGRDGAGHVGAVHREAR